MNYYCVSITAIQKDRRTRGIVGIGSGVYYGDEPNRSLRLRLDSIVII